MRKSKSRKNPGGRRSTEQQMAVKEKIWELYLDQLEENYNSIAHMSNTSAQYAIQVITRKKADTLDELWNLRYDPSSVVQHLQNVVGGSIRYRDEDAHARTLTVDPTVGSGKGMA